MKIGVVIPVGPGRKENLAAVLSCVASQGTPPAAVVVVEDGDALGGDRILIGETPEQVAFWKERTLHVRAPKHEPGMEQPRNLGVRTLRARTDMPVCTHVWFLDSDVVVEPDCLETIELALEQADQDRILVCPYDWLGPGLRPHAGFTFPLEYHDLHNDPRWPSFEKYDPDEAVTNDLSAGLACFSGNLVWPIERFERVGGFWSEIHHGRCEDGELGLRAAAMGVPISFARDARGWHLHHEVNTALAVERNARDVPMLNARHPWVEGTAVFMVDRDGAAFDVSCPNCHEQIPTILWWQHTVECGVSPEIPVT